MRVRHRLAVRRTIRLRLSLLYGGLFFASGAALLAVTYLLVVHTTHGFVFERPDGSIGFAQGQAPAATPEQSPATHAGGSPRDPQPTRQQTEAQARAAQTQATGQRERVLHQLLTQSAIALAGMGTISIALGWLVAGRALRPLRTITATARAISAANLHERLALNGPDDELTELGDTFDELLARLETAFDSQRRFVANASHELRTPLARQRALVQVALADPTATVDSLRYAHERVLASEEQLERLIEALLTLSRGHAGLHRRQPLDLAELACQLLITRHQEAALRGITLHQQLEAAPAHGDARLVERLLANLIDNALRYNHAGGRVEVVTAHASGQATATVSNTGPLVPAAAIDELFQPFRRLESERTKTKSGEGLGLGLSIVRAIADAHDATLSARPRPHGGLDITMRFPGRRRDHRRS